MASAMGLGWTWKPREQKRRLPPLLVSVPLTQDAGAASPAHCLGYFSSPSNQPPQQMSSQSLWEELCLLRQGQGTRVLPGREDGECRVFGRREGGEETNTLVGPHWASVSLTV